MSDTLTMLSKLATEQLVHRGARVFEVPVKQLFDFDESGELVVSERAEANRRVIAELALEFEHCNYRTSGVSLRRSLVLDGNTSLLYAAGCKLVCAITVDDGARARMIAFALVMPAKPSVIEPTVLKALGNHLPTKALFLELICSEPRSGGATLLLVRLLGKLSRTNTGILAHAVNQKSRTLLERHHYALPTTRKDVFYLDRETAAHHVADYMRLMRVGTILPSLCTRRGVTRATEGREFWDCR